MQSLGNGVEGTQISLKKVILPVTVREGDRASTGDSVISSSCEMKYEHAFIWERLRSGEEENGRG